MQGSEPDKNFLTSQFLILFTAKGFSLNKINRQLYGGREVKKEEDGEEKRKQRKGDEREEGESKGKRERRRITETPSLVNNGA